MDKVSDIIRAFEGPSKLATAIDVPLGTVSSWKTRGSIPVEHWPVLVAAAEARGIRGLTYENLTLMHAGRARGNHPSASVDKSSTDDAAQISVAPAPVAEPAEAAQ